MPTAADGEVRRVHSLSLRALRPKGAWVTNDLASGSVCLPGAEKGQKERKRKKPQEPNRFRKSTKVNHTKWRTCNKNYEGKHADLSGKNPKNRKSLEKPQKSIIKRRPCNKKRNTKVNHTCRNMPFCGRARQDSRVRFPKEERCAESPPTFICGKRRINRKRPDLRTF